MRFLCTITLSAALAAAVPAARTVRGGVDSGVQDAPAPPVDPLHKPFDEILDQYVRDGLVYYNALRIERGKLDGYVRSLGAQAGDEVSKWPPPRRLAYWINAYNAFVLQTVIDRYPIRGKAPQYPASSIRQIPGAFETRTFRAGGRQVTLDQIEKELAAAEDARSMLALGRGAIGGGRLRSEAFTAERLEQQLGAAAAESVDRREMVFVDRAGSALSVSPIFSWREAAFVAAYGDKAPAVFSTRSPLERAVLALIDPVLAPSEATFLRENQFRMVFHEFDWRLNDLTGR
jgi:hypothetical protein